MKTVALVALLVGGVIPLAPSHASEVDPAIHKLCIEAKDYLGCVKAMKGESSSSERQSVDIDMIRTTGNTCPSTMAYTGAGYCEKVICIPNYRGHDSRLGGKGWSCKGGNTLQFTGAPVRATTDERCPLTEPELGKNNSCVNGLSEDEINKGYRIFEQKAQKKISFGFQFEVVEGERALKVIKVIPRCSFAKAGMMRGDKLKSVNGLSFGRSGDIKADGKLFAELASSEKAARFVYERNGAMKKVKITPSMCSFPAMRGKFNASTNKFELLD